MQKDGVHTLQPTALAIKQIPSSSATVNTGSFPDEVTITLRHVPQPEHLAKSYGSNYTTYHAYLVNNNLNTKTFLGPVSKLRPGTFQLIAENIPAGTWDQLVVSLSHDDPSDLGMPIFTYVDKFCNPIYTPERYTTLPADFPRTAQQQPKDTLIPEKKQEEVSGAWDINITGPLECEPGIASPELSKPSASSKETAISYDSEDENMLLQPGTVLPEGENYSGYAGTASPSNQKAAPMDGPIWFDTGTSTEEEPEQTLGPIVINELPNHALWLVNYQGIQLVGYTYNASDPKKPTFIVHGVPGDHNRKGKPKEQGYDYWIADPSGKNGYWLRYVNPHDNLVAHPFPVTDLRKK